MSSGQSLPRICIACAILLPVIALAAAHHQNQFAWVPSYPGAQVTSSRTANDGHQLTYKIEFHVKDDGAAVRSFYEKKLTAAGFHVIGKAGATGNGWDLYADSPDGTRTVDLSGDAQSQGVNVRITARRIVERSD